MATSRASVCDGDSCRQRSTTASSSWPSLNTSAVTLTGSPTALFTGWRPQSICGCTFSIRMLPMRPAIRPPPAADVASCRERGQCGHSYEWRRPDVKASEGPGGLLPDGRSRRTLPRDGTGRVLLAPHAAGALGRSRPARRGLQRQLFFVLRRDDYRIL